MIAIKGFKEMPNACTSTQEILGDIVVANCPLYNICKHRDTIRTNYKPSDCPLVQIEEPKVERWNSDGHIVCTDCDEYNQEKHYCPKFCDVIRETAKEMQDFYEGEHEKIEKIEQVMTQVDDGYYEGGRMVDTNYGFIVDEIRNILEQE